MTVDDQGRPGDGSGWLTLTEAAARTGYSRDALRQRIRRGKLVSSKGNDGQVRVQARDLGDLPPADLSVDDQEQVDDPTLDVLQVTVDDLRTDLGRTRTALDKALVDRLNDHGRAERAEAQAVAASARAAAAEARLATAEAERDTAAADIARERDRAENALIRAAASEAEAKALREALVEARQPFWRRWMG